MLVRLQDNSRICLLNASSWDCSSITPPYALNGVQHIDLLSTSRELLSSAIKYCQSAKLLLNQSASCPGGICSIASCCRAPQTCYEATSIEYLYLYLSNSCSPTGCTTSQCCRLPETCLETLFATTNFDNVPRFCLREGFADNFWGNCSGNCTTAECCLPNTCNTWRSGASTRDVCPFGVWTRTCHGWLSCGDLLPLTSPLQ